MTAALPYSVIIGVLVSSVILYLGEVGVTERMYYRYQKVLHDKKEAWSSVFYNKQKE